MLYEGDTLVGVLLTHVDDFLYGGHGKRFDEAMEKIKKEMDNSRYFAFNYVPILDRSNSSRCT